MATAIAQIDSKQLCLDLLCAESEEAVTSILEQLGLLAPCHWKVLGDMPNNRSMVDNQQHDPAGALVEKIVNGMDAMLTKGCFLQGVDPEAPKAPPDMLAAAERFFGVKRGDLANLLPRELTKLAENIQLLATGTKSEPCYVIIDQGEGQTPERFEDTFLSLKRSNKAKIHFVQGKFNCGGTGVLPFCGRNAYQLIISKRCPELPSGPRIGEARDSSHRLWGFTLVRALPASLRIFDTKTYVYLAPGGKVPTFDSKEIPALPEVISVAAGDEPEAELEPNGDNEERTTNTPRPYVKGLPFGTVIKLYNYRWPAKSTATTDARFALEKYLYKLCLPFRIVETRAGYRANYFATTVSGTAVTIASDHRKGHLEKGFPLGGEICPEGVGPLPVFIALYRERSGNGDNGQEGSKKVGKDPRRLPKGLSFTINGQVHYTLDSMFFASRGLKYEFIKDTLVVVVDCTGLPEDVRDCLVMPSRDRLRKLTEFDGIIDSIVADLKDREALRQANDERKLRRVKAALEDGATQEVFQHLVNKDPVFAALFTGGIKLRNPWFPGPTRQEYKGKLPPTFFHFEGGKSSVEKSFAIDRTCTVELETDAANGYFELPNPDQCGTLRIEPPCYDRWNLMNGKLRIVFRAPSNARIGDSLNVSLSVTDPFLSLKGDSPWFNTVRLAFTEGGKEVKPGNKAKKRESSGSLSLPDIQLVYRNQWDDHQFNDKSALRITKEENDNYRFWVNMDNAYLHNELMQRKDAEKESAKFAYKWGLVLVALGMLQELKRQNEKPGGQLQQESEGDEPVEPIEKQVCRVSGGVAAVIIPTVLHLMDTMNEMSPTAQPTG